MAAAGVENFGQPAGTAGSHPPVVVSSGKLLSQEPSNGKCGGAAPEHFPEVRSEKKIRLCSAGLDMCLATELGSFDFEPTCGSTGVRAVAMSPSAGEKCYRAPIAIRLSQ